MEDIPGVLIASLMNRNNQFGIPPPIRLDVMAQILEMDCRLRFIGLKNRDLAPRNVMFVMDTNYYTKPPCPVVNLDFADSTVVSSENCKFRHLAQDPNYLPRGPNYYWWDAGSPEEFATWVARPTGVYLETRTWNCRLIKRWSNSKEWNNESVFEGKDKNNIEHLSPEQEHVPLSNSSRTFFMALLSS